MDRLCILVCSCYIELCLYLPRFFFTGIKCGKSYCMQAFFFNITNVMELFFKLFELKVFRKYLALQMQLNNDTENYKMIFISQAQSRNFSKLKKTLAVGFTLIIISALICKWYSSNETPNE